MEILIYISLSLFSVIIGILLDRIFTLGKLREHKEIKKQAFTDQLTGKGNRHKFVEDMERLIARKNKFAVCFMDLDGFKNINDTMGHDAGDILLIELGKRLDKNLPENTESYRLGGDEFAILMKNVNTVEEITKVLDKLKEGLTLPIVIDNIKITLEYSLGVAIYPTDSTSRSELMTYADDAMYYIKEHGKNDYYFHNSVLKAKLENKKKMEVNLKLAVEREEFIVEYAPRLNLKQNEIAMEASLVWNHPVLGRIYSDYFMKQAEEMGIDILLDEHLIDKVCDKINYFNEKSKKVKFFVNISNKHVNRNDFIKKIISVISSHNIPNGSLELCFSQKLSIDKINNYKNFTEQMKNIGVEVNMSNLELRLETLRNFKEIDIKGIRLDLSFSNANSNFNNAIISDIINVCKDLDYIVTAAGITTKEQLKKVVNSGANYVQGTIVHKSLEEKEIEEYVMNYESIVSNIINKIKE